MKRLSLAVLSLVAASFAADNLALWSKYKSISINTKASGANVAGNVLKFPVLVRLDSVNAADVFAGASAGGADIRFANAAGAARPFEIEYWNATAKKAAIWVLADTVKGNDSVAALRLYWGNPSAAPGSNGPAVFEKTNGYVGAWHLGNAPGVTPRPSSVAGAPAAVLKNYQSSDAAIPGVIGLADTLRGGGAGTEEFNYIDINGGSITSVYDGYTDFSTGLAYSLWFKSSGNIQFQRLLNMAPDESGVGTGSTDRVTIMGNQNGSATAPNIGVRLGGGTVNQGSYSYDTWVHLFVTKAPGGNVNIYRDGALLYSGATNEPTVVGRPYAWLGRAYNENLYYIGVFDNLTLSKTTRDSSFVKLSYQTQKIGASAVVLGSTQTQTVTPVAVSALTYTSKPADTLVFRSGAAVSVNPSITGGPVDSFKVVGAALPAGLTLAKSNGVLSGTPSAAAASADYTIRAWGHAAAGDSTSRTVRITVFAPATLTYTPDSVVYNINTAITAKNPTYTGSTPTTYSVTPALPTGLSLAASTGIITGTPTVASPLTPYTIRVVTPYDTATKVVRIRVFDPTSINGREGSLASGFSARSSAQGILFRMAGTQSGEKAVLNLVDMWGRTVFTGAFQGGALNWNGKSTKGHEVSSGIYVARVKIVDAQGRMRKVNEHKVPFTR
jgi:hypothetical protein